jgi:hypothetical protein
MLLQKGTVIKKSQIFRVFSERVAIKYAVGTPKIMVNNVVQRDSLNDLQNIDK